MHLESAHNGIGVNLITSNSYIFPLLSTPGSRGSLSAHLHDEIINKNCLETGLCWRHGPWSKDGLCKVKQIKKSEKTMEVDGWVQVSLGNFSLWKIVPK